MLVEGASASTFFAWTAAIRNRSVGAEALPTTARDIEVEVSPSTANGIGLAGVPQRNAALAGGVSRFRLALPLPAYSIACTSTSRRFLVAYFSADWNSPCQPLTASSACPPLPARYTPT
ncbi:DUF6053 domain-containing protein [Lysobacter enzymogenes]|uniref:DUF6053 domain-containing protein n=1 Tax=Lysobacter enzymogenes TaxID=69 RepID=UPI003D18C397